MAGRVTIEEGVVFGTTGDRDLRCDVFRPEEATGPLPGVLLVHGGGWRTGDRTQLRGYGILLGRAGYVCVASEYRLIPESPWPAQIHDVKAAIRWMRANAAELGIDPDRIAIEGNSAGAHLALLAAGTPGVDELEGEGGHPGTPTDVAAVIGVYAPTLFTHEEQRRGGLTLLALTDIASAEAASTASPLTHVSPGFPPTMLIHGAGDELVPVHASLVMYEALADAGVPTELHLYADQPHAFDADPAFGRQCAAEMLLFLDRYVRDRTPADTSAAT
jgi:acetyl esterase/lipase